MSDIAPQFLSVGNFNIRRWENKIGSLEIKFWAIISKKKILIFGKEFVAGLSVCSWLQTQIRQLLIMLILKT